MKRLLKAACACLSICTPALADDSNSVAALIAGVEALPVPKFSLNAPPFMIVTNRFNTTSAESEDGICLGVQAAPTNFISFQTIRDLDRRAFRRVAPSLQKAVESPCERLILGEVRNGIRLSDLYNGSARTTETYIFLYEDCTITLHLQYFDASKDRAGEAFRGIVESLKLERPQPSSGKGRGSKGRGSGLKGRGSGLE